MRAVGGEGEDEKEEGMVWAQEAQRASSSSSIIPSWAWPPGLTQVGVASMFSFSQTSACAVHSTDEWIPFQRRPNRDRCLTQCEHSAYQ